MTTILRESLGEEGARSLSNTIKDLISAGKGKVLNSDFWGKRKFTYDIKRDTEGFYEVLTFEAAPEKLAGFKKRFNILEGLLRYLIVSKS